ncbi:MBL fold metallo-hydrolase [bacterium]|nr:MBL fold metallo-hydrolase [bacterium]
MRELLKNLYVVEPSKATALKYISFFVKRKRGNLLFPCFSNQSTITERFGELEAMGGVGMQLLGDSHFRTAHCDEVGEHFGCSLHCSEAEREAVEQKCVNVTAFPFEHRRLASDIDVVPTPGHRPGGVCFLVDLPDGKVLFAGDALWFDGKRWMSFPSSKGRSKLIASFTALKELPFDYITCNTKVQDQQHCLLELKDEKQRRRFIDEQIKLIS